MSKVFKCKFCNKAYSAMRTLKQHEMDKHDINLNTGQVKFSNSMMGIFEDLKTNEVDPDVEPEVIVDKIGLMHEILNDLLDNVFIDSEKSSKINNVFKSNKVFTCDVCGKLLKSKQNLKYHVEVVYNS